MSRGQRELIDLSEGQLRKVAEIIHLQEVEKLKELEFNSYAEQQKYLNDTKAVHDKVEKLLNDAGTMKAKTEQETDATKKQIASDIYEYCTKTIGVSLQFIRSYNTRLTYLGKLAAHSESLIDQLYRLDPATQMKEAQRLAIEAGMYKKATLEYAKKFQHFVPNQFTKWLKDTGKTFEDLVQEYVAKNGFAGPFKNLEDIEKLQVYEGIMEAAGEGRAVGTYAFEALGAVGVALLVFTAGIMVWDIYTAENKVEAAVRDSVNALTQVVNVVVDDIATAAVEAGFEALDIEIASAAVTVIGTVAGFGIGVIIGIAAGALLDLIFGTGSQHIHTTDGLTVCRVAPMPDGFQLARLVKQQYPDL